MTCAQVSEAMAFCERWAVGNSTPDDFARIEHHAVVLRGVPAQLHLIDGGAA